MDNQAEMPASLSANLYPMENFSESERPSEPQRTRRLRGYIAVALVVAILVGGVYASFVSTHTFSYSNSTTPIVNKSLSYSFVANELTPTLASCNTIPCSFNVAGSGTVAVTAQTSVMSGSGVTITTFQASPLSIPCSTSPPTTGTGVVSIPLPGQTGPVSFTGGTDYAYCIYYTSGTSIVQGSFTVDYSA